MLPIGNIFTILTVTLCFTQFSTRIHLNGNLNAPALVPVLTQRIFTSSIVSIKVYKCFKNVIHQIDRNKWLLLSVF